MKKFFLILLALSFSICGFAQEFPARGGTATFFVIKTGDQPANITVIQRGRQTTLHETEIDKAPESVRPYLRSQESLPRGTTLLVMKTGEQPAKITVIERGRQTELNETEIGNAPEPVRAYLESMFKIEPAEPETLEVTYTIEDSAKDAANIEEWAKKAAELCREWHPKLEQYLATEGFTPPRKIEIVFRKMDGVAFSSRNQIVISSDWVTARPDDWGMVVHELVHVIQSYRRGGPGWVTEGIADYIRHAHFEPDGPWRTFHPDQAKYTDAYQITAAFFIWLEKNKCPDLVQQLNKVSRAGTYTDEIFETTCGAALDTLWAEYIADIKKLFPDERHGEFINLNHPLWREYKAGLKK